MDHSRVFAFLQARQQAGQPCVLVTVLRVEGSSMRNPGTHMGVAADGEFAGSLSGGCIENAVVAEALEALTEGAARVVRFGAGSPYLDITLPCGGGLDIHFQPLDGPEQVEACCAAIKARLPFSLSFENDEAEYFEGVRTGALTFCHWPQPRLLIVGHGAGVEALARLGQAMELEVAALTPDARVLQALENRGVEAAQLHKTSDTHLLQSDPWTAVVFLFHDHDWEVQMMARALELPQFYVGAMGSRKAHTARCTALVEAGVGQEAIGSIQAPLGLFHSSRDPETLALSALGEILQAYHTADFAAADG